MQKDGAGLEMFTDSQTPVLRHTAQFARVCRGDVESGPDVVEERSPAFPHLEPC